MAEEVKNITADETQATNQTAVVDIGETKAETKTKVVKKRGKKNVAMRQVASGRAYVKSTYNNTLVTLTDQSGNVLSWSSAGQCGFKGPKKSTPYAATIIVKNVCEKAKKYGLKEVMVYVRGIGGGREAAVRALNANGLAVSGIKDVTPIPHNGCRPKKPRRV